ncbi:MAG: hypothetical protein H6552_09725 [Chitinophagales bacterium]|nr:hypothetical protein [Chitinophagales bacterium]
MLLQVICPCNPPTNITLVGYTGNIQWQSSPDNSTWTDMLGATTTSNQHKWEVLYRLPLIIEQ